MPLRPRGRCSLVTLRLAVSMGAVQTAVSMVLSFLSIKVTSVYLGPAGIGTLSQLTYFTLLAQSIIAAGVHTGLVRRTAQLANDAPGRARVVSTVLRGFLVAGMLTAGVIAVGSDWIAVALLHDISLNLSLKIYAAVFVFGLVAAAITATANGAQDFRGLTVVNVGTALSAFGLMVGLAPLYGLGGALVATAALPLVTFSIAWAVARKRAWWPSKPFSHGFSMKEARSVVAFVPLAVISSVGLPLLQLLIRDDVAAASGMGAVGFLQGVVRISDMYLGIAGTLLAMYYFPRFSEIDTADELVNELLRGVLAIVPLAAIAGLLIYLLRDWVVRFIFTAEFFPMRDLFGWQMAGNTLKMLSWLFGYVLLAKANAYLLAALEIATIFVWWLLSVYFIGIDGAVGATRAYTLTYAAYSVATIAGVSLVVRGMRNQERIKRTTGADDA